jgi:intein/homing endonuclease
LTDEFGNEIEIYKIEILSGELTIYDLGVEDNDLYIANGILTHK